MTALMFFILATTVTGCHCSGAPTLTTAEVRKLVEEAKPSHEAVFEQFSIGVPNLSCEKGHWTWFVHMEPKNLNVPPGDPWFEITDLTKAMTFTPGE